MLVIRWKRWKEPISRSPSGSAGVIILSLDHYEAVGDHYLYICRVEAVFSDPSIKPLFAYGGYGRIATAD